MGRTSLSVSYNLGRTWSEPVRFPEPQYPDDEIKVQAEPPKVLRPGKNLLKLADGTVIDLSELQYMTFNRVKIRDGSTLIGYSGNYQWNGSDCEEVTFFRATDLGQRGEFLGRLREYPPHSISEPAILRLPDGRLCAFIRERRMDHFPAIKAFSSNEGKT